MTEQRKGELPVGTRVRMQGTGRTGTIREVIETHDRVVYYVVQDTIPEDAVTGTGEPAAECGTYRTADAFEVLPS